MKKKKIVLYSAVSCPLDRSKRFTLFASPDRPVHSDTNSASPGSILVRQQLRAKTKSLTCPPLSIARYSFIQLSQLGPQLRERKCPIFETVAKEDSNPGSLDCESGILPLSYRAPHNEREELEPTDPVQGYDTISTELSYRAPHNEREELEPTDPVQGYDAISINDTEIRKQLSKMGRNKAYELDNLLIEAIIMVTELNLLLKDYTAEDNGKWYPR